MTLDKLDAFREVLALGLIAVWLTYFIFLLGGILFDYRAIKIMQSCALLGMVFAILITTLSLFDPSKDSTVIKVQAGFILISALLYIGSIAYSKGVFERSTEI